MSTAIDQTVEPQSASYREAEALFRQTQNRINNLSAAERLWNYHFLAHERAALGGNLREAVNRHGTPIRLWATVRGVSEQRAVLEVGEALNFLTSAGVDFILREAGELPRNRTEAREAAIERGDLVLTRLPREAYWRGELIDVDWNREGASWDFLMIAAESAQSGKPIDHFSFGASENPDVDVVAKKKHRLKSLNGFPSGLIDCFQVAGRGTQRLNIPHDQVHIFADGDL